MFSVGNESPAQAKNLVEVNPDGSGRLQVSGLSDVVNDLAPVFSPDGNRLAFGRCEAKLGGCSAGIPIYVASADGTGAHAVTSSYDGTASWSPDGTQLAVLDQTPELGIYIVNADGTGRRLLIKGSAGGTGSPTWSPDGQRIAFYDDAFPGQPQQLGLYLVDVAGDVNDESRKHLLLADHAGSGGAGDCDQLQGYAFDWSPDGAKLVYQCLAPDGAGGANGDVATVDTATGATARIVSTPATSSTGVGVEWFPRWSPDGTRIVYERESQIWTASATGTDQHALMAGYRPSWQPCVGATTRCGPPPAPPASAGGTTTGSGGSVGGDTAAQDKCPAAAGPLSNFGCPVNAFTLGKVRPTHRGTVFSVKVPGPGSVSVAGTRRTRAARVRAAKAGAVKLTLRPTLAGRTSLRSTPKFVASVKVTYRPDGGIARTTTARIKFIR